jgi:hypothetical protein
MEDAHIEDEVREAEKTFSFPKILQTEYFQKYRKNYYRHTHHIISEQGFFVGTRHYLNLLKFLNEISEYNENHARSFVRRFQSSQKDWLNCEAIFSEVIVYRYYIRLVYEGLIKSISLNEKEGDIIIERIDGTKAYLEVFCVMPNIKMHEKAGEIIVGDMRTHTQNAMASIRQKLLRKINKQKQLSKPRDNYAVIELNESLISGDFTILSSLSGGYKLWINRESGKTISEGYDWRDSIFNDEATKYLKGIIYFSLGNYESRKFIPNHNA